MRRADTQPCDEAASCVLCAGADPTQVTALDDLVPAGRSRFVAETESLVTVPTFGCFVRGYLVIVPRPHVLSFGQLPAAVLQEAHMLVDELADRLQQVYGLPVLGFEYGLATPGARRIEHAHWHLLPSDADLARWLDQRLHGRPLGGLTDLPADHSYIAVRAQDQTVSLYDTGRTGEQARRTHDRIRLRRAVAALDPRVEDGAWDWADHRCADLITATLSDLAAPTTQVMR